MEEDGIGVGAGVGMGRRKYNKNSCGLLQNYQT